MITGILHTTFLTTDLTQSRAFYEGVLGLQLNLDRPTMNYDGVWYDVADKQQIHLMLLPNPEAGHVALAVSNIAKLIMRLDQAEVVYTLSQSGRRAVFCRDPDGNALEFIGNS
jgi:glyoxylase I family protein